MTKETKASLLLDEYNEKRDALKAEYQKRRNEADDMEVHYWYTEEDNKLEKWFINAIFGIAVGFDYKDFDIRR